MRIPILLTYSLVFKDLNISLNYIFIETFKSDLLSIPNNLCRAMSHILMKITWIVVLKSLRILVKFIKKIFWRILRNLVRPSESLHWATGHISLNSYARAISVVI